MEQRESFERSSSETPATAAAPPTNSEFGASNGPLSGQTTIAPHSTASAYENSPIVDNVLKSDVCP